MREQEEGNEYDFDSDDDFDSAQDKTNAQLRKELEELRAEKKDGWRQLRNAQLRKELEELRAEKKDGWRQLRVNHSLCARFRDVHGAWLNTSCQRRPGCKCSTCRTFFDENGKWSEVRASWSISRAPSQDWNILPVFGPWPAPGLVSQDRCAISSITTATLPCTNSARTLHNASDIYVIAAGTALVITPFGPAVESPPHAKSVAYIQSGDFKIVPTAHFAALFPTPLSERGEWKSESAKCYSARTHTAAQSGAVIDTGAQRGATGNRSEILQKTDTTLKMQPAVGPAKHMKGILMGAETIDMHGTPFVLVVPDVSAFDPDMSDSLVSAGRLMEKGFRVIFRIPSEADVDGFSSSVFPLYGGTITTPDGATVIVMEYLNHTWRLPKANVHQKKNRAKCGTGATAAHSFASTPQATGADEEGYKAGNSFALLPEGIGIDEDSYVPDYLSEERAEGRLQQRFELFVSRQREALCLHDCNAHCCNRQLLDNLEAKDIPHKHLK